MMAISLSMVCGSQITDLIMMFAEAYPP